MNTSHDSLVHSGIPDQLEKTLKSLEGHDQIRWFTDKLNGLLENPSAREFYLTYTLIHQKFGDLSAAFQDRDDQNVVLKKYGMTAEEAFRLLLLYEVLKRAPGYYADAVQKLIEVADKNELITFLKFLDLLPEAERFCDAAVQALRTNIEPVFDAIALRNTYPQKYFNQQQWNQMYLKAAFMQRPLLEIEGVETRANKELSRIISDYAHERWAASRNIDPRIWRPVAIHPVESTKADMQHLLTKGSKEEVNAAVLVCTRSKEQLLHDLVADQNERKERIAKGTLNWNNLNL